MTRRLAAAALPLSFLSSAACLSARPAAPAASCAPPGDPAAAEAVKLSERRRQLLRGALRPWSDEARAALRLQWERDEDGYGSLPARAWPAYQPGPEDVPGIQERLRGAGCYGNGGGGGGGGVGTEEEIGLELTDDCATATFDLATAFVFYNLQAETGLGYYKKLAASGHADGMVAAGICLVEGFGVEAQEREGLEYLRRSVARGSAQGHYELGTALFTGLDGVLEEDEAAAFAHFEAAAGQGHIGGCFMAADCLLSGTGCVEDVQRAVPLLFTAAEGGHRFARQKLRELFVL